MCGIAGLVGRADQSIEAGDVHSMCQTIVHRGPDDEGIYTNGPVGLGMRRLSIIDLSGGHQPIHNEDKSVWLVFNGEIYNFPELRQELEARGHKFYTNTDTEMIVHLYEEMGADCVKKLRGMFAIALYDERKRSLLLARDRLGKKPLHYALHEGRLLFGSEIKTILAIAPDLAEVDSEGLLQYFYFGYIPDPYTAFSGIRKLPPGHLMEYTNGKIEIRQYWDVVEYGTHPAMSEQECLQELERRLEEAVRIRLISDVPLGALLSGGVDSSIIVALMARVSSGPVKTFSIGFRAEQFNEAEYARLVAERFGTEHHELVLDPTRASTARAASIASSATVSPAMNRRAKLAGLRMPYRDASFFRAGLRARRWKNALGRAVEHQWVRPRGDEQVLDRARVIAQHGALADAEPAAFGDDDAARLERLGGFLDRLAAAGHAEVGVPRGELLDQPIDARLEIAPRDRRPHRRGEHRGRQHLVERADARPDQPRQLEHVAARLRRRDRRR